MEFMMSMTVRLVGLIFAIKLSFSLLSGVIGKLGDVAELIGEDMGDKLCRWILNIWVFISATATKLTSGLVRKKGTEQEMADTEIFEVDDIPDVLQEG